MAHNCAVEILNRIFNLPQINSMQKSEYVITSYHSRGWDEAAVVLGEFLATDVESVEGIGAVCAVFEEVFFGLRKFLTAFVLAET